MTSKNYTSVERGERVDQGDMQNIAETSHRDALSQLLEELVMGQDGAPVLLYGFNVVLSGGNVVTVSRGAALTGFRDRGMLYRAMVLAGGPPTKSYSISSYPNGTYGVYVRLSMRPAATKTRRFWNALAGPAKEVARLIRTRISEDYDVAIERNNPGNDYLLLGTVPIAGGTFSSAFTVVGTRLFESGRVNRVFTDAEWGATPDRNPADVIGLRGLVRWAKMVNRQLQDIIGPGFFGSSPQAGTEDGSDGSRSLTQLNDEKLARTGAQPMAGDLVPDADNTREIGGVSTRWFSIRSVVSYMRDLNQLADDPGTGVGTGVTSHFFNYNAPAGKQNAVFSNKTDGSGLEVRSGNAFGATGQQAIHLNGTGVKLARYSEPQNGVFQQFGGSVAIPNLSFAPGSVQSFNMTLTPPAGVTYTTGDWVIGCNATGPGIGHADSFSLIRPPRITANNVVTVWLDNEDPVGNQPVGAVTLGFDFLIMKLT